MKINKNNYKNKIKKNKLTQHYKLIKMSYMDINHGEILDMVHRKSCVDSTMEVWEKKRQAEWAEKDANWEKEYDARIAEEERKAKEAKERFDNMTEEELEAEMNRYDMFEDSDYEDSDEEDGDDEIDTSFLPCIEDDIDLTPEQKKAKEWEDYKKQSKEWREKRTREIHNTFCYCSWRQLRSYRTQLGLSNEGFEWSN